jgi:hypothetical protein
LLNLDGPAATSQSSSLTGATRRFTVCDAIPNTNASRSVLLTFFTYLVVTGLTTLTGAINTLITAYIGHTNQLLNGGTAAAEGLDTSAVSAFLNSAGLGAQPNTGVPIKKEKKKRVKKEKDPNAPKRPLTAFFLFSTNARELVKADLGSAGTPVLVNDEILRRWKAMDEAGKKVRFPTVCGRDLTSY